MPAASPAPLAGVLEELDLDPNKTGIEAIFDKYAMDHFKSVINPGDVISMRKPEQCIEGELVELRSLRAATKPLRIASEA